MNARLQEKIDEIKKNLRDDDDFQPLLCFDANPREFDIELPADYISGTETLLKLVEHRDFLVRELPYFSFEDLAPAREALHKLAGKIERLETLLEREYKEIVKDQRQSQELCEATWLQDQISREHFIMVKHLKPHIFEEFKKWVFRYMTDEEIKEELTIIKSREKTELAAILAADIREPEFINPHYRRQSPYDLYNRYTLYLADEAYETDGHFKEIYQTIETGEEAKRRFTDHMANVLPVARRRLDEGVRSLEPKIRKLCRHLCDYSREKVRTGKFLKRADADQKKVEEHINYIQHCRIDIFIYTKHEKPNLLAEFKKLAFQDMTKAEIEEFYQKVAEYGEKQLDIIVRAVKMKFIEFYQKFQSDKFSF